MSYELRQYSSGETIGKGFNLYFDNFIPIILISLLCQIPDLLLILSFNHMNEFLQFFIYISWNITFRFFLSACIVNLASHKFLQIDFAGKDNQSTSFRTLIFPAIGLSIVVVLATIVSFLAFIIPGIVVASGYSIATQALVVERLKILDAMERSWSLTKGKKWSIFGILLVCNLIVFGISMVFSRFFELMNFNSQLTNCLSVLINAFISPVQSCILVVVYFNLRIEKEGFNIENLAEQFTLAGKRESSTEA